MLIVPGQRCTVMAQDMMGRISLVRGEITEQRVDVVVNAANPSLSGGGGVDGAIHRAAGPELDAECRMLGGCATGDAVMTKGYRLPARYVIHTVGPVWSGGTRNEDALLASCYRQALAHADFHGLKTIAFPAISTGAYGFPLERATRIAVATVADYIRSSRSRLTVTFVCHSDDACRVYETVMKDPAVLRADEKEAGGTGEAAEPAGIPGDIRELVAGQLAVIGDVYGIRIVNRDAVINGIVKIARNREEASRITAAINSWVAVKNLHGRTEIPTELIARFSNQ